MLVDLVLDDTQIEYIVGLIEKDIRQFNIIAKTSSEFNEAIVVREQILENIRYFYKHRKVED